MNYEIHFRLNAITKITLNKRRPSDYFWKEAQPEVRKFFGLIKVKAKPAGWYSVEDEWYDRVPKLTGDILEYSWYGFDQAKNEIYVKPHVEVRLMDKSEIGYRFNTDKEAMDWIDGIVAQSEHKFAVIGR
jgi:hypothetical protein